ncbi:FkbM family methyltransferase [Synechococcus sp. CS-602]|nr:MULTISPECIES: FkbM family methyltransferase [Synechococcaceae]MCT0203030.1 FkbM family methyltransferase [Synechococcus sp. CS-603]MCT0245529.1 FkbM family methyltransferase [Synechococcus sp. CS-601]MCT4365820.1 FkbM family methyltransferase [Candidatus Regnicoccus frigidus MAG-AL1]MCT0203932.1 FkbM family methyltransferase [Synechococcus sp. CS-602]MCT4366719.1 FkbM family methyltransferase [Candidatus Regnicoccus frigidus MAG-AL2]
MLWRALKHVEKGFYVDIGAQDPLVDSVSLAFYEHGWRGVNVEPTQQYSELLKLARPDEIVMQVAIGNQSGTLKFYEFADTGLSTAVTDLALRHQEEGFRYHETLVPVISLDMLFDRIGVQDIHWMKIDVEESEGPVLESWQSELMLPWVLVIESTRPLTQDKSYNEWEQLLLRKGYKFVYFDGLNRFYVSHRHFELVSSFSSPPNVFDGFVLSGSASHPFCRFVENKVQQAENKAQQAESKALRVLATADQYHAQLAAVLASTSWHLTKPLRWSMDFIHRMRRLRVQVKVKEVSKRMLFRAIRVVNNHPRLKRAVITSASRLGAANKLGELYFAWQVHPVGFQHFLPKAPEDLNQLSPRARQIYADLKGAIKVHQEGQR